LTFDERLIPGEETSLLVNRNADSIELITDIRRGV
jgi:hypothetical protein